MPSPRKPKPSDPTYQLRPPIDVSNEIVRNMQTVLGHPRVNDAVIRAALTEAQSLYQVFQHELDGAADSRALAESWEDIRKRVKQLIVDAGSYNLTKLAAEKVAGIAEVEINRLLVPHRKAKDIAFYQIRTALMFQLAQEKYFDKAAPDMARVEKAVVIGLKAVGIEPLAKDRIVAPPVQPARERW